jgi:hypothetical protein
MKENFHILKFKKNKKKNFRGQIQCQNSRFKMCDSSLIRINMPTSENVMYKKAMTSWLTKRQMTSWLMLSW